ncbi:MAG: RagB/SusD family nutrient uptake outer membrane protein, partial [Flavihumibacter sp.]
SLRQGRRNPPGGGWATFTDFSESFPSENGSAYFVERTGWGYGEWGTWDYGYIRDLNLFLQRMDATELSTKITAEVKAGFLAEGRFLRANYYFEMVKRMGGVPLITEPMEYDYKGNATYLQHPRAKESEVYDFVISEAEAIKNDLPANLTDKSRATKAAALAMESRAALYAGSIAKYGASTPAVKLPGGEVGIPAEMAQGYYTIALRAANEIISKAAGNVSLYQALPNLEDNFAAIFLDKTSVNQEAIFIEDFKAFSGKTHAYTTNNQPYSRSDEGGDAGRLNPSLNLVEQFELLNGTYAPLNIGSSASRTAYEKQEDLFAGRDARLLGTILVPGAYFKSGQLKIKAGEITSSGNIVTTDGSGNSLVGTDGPVNGLEFRTQTGFYVRKWLDPQDGSGRRGRGSDVAFIRYRFGEVLLNAAEAAYELGQPDVAAGFMNQIRERAGITTPLTAGDINFDRIVHERRVELAFEGHILFDYKRWRIADKVWNGDATSYTDIINNLGKATAKSTQPWGLWPYLVQNGPDAGKWIYIETKPARVTGSNRFQLGNYYSAIGDDIRAANPTIVRQPNQ